MSRLDTVIASYARYHRDPRNITYHSVGIPTIVFAVLILLARAGVTVGPLTVTPAAAVVLLSTLWYVSLDVALGGAMFAASLFLLWVASATASLGVVPWLALGAGLFAGGWVLQFVGHGHEGRKPAFIDDLKSLAVGPLFVMVELFYALGWKPELHRVVEREAGPVRRREISPA